MKIINEFPVYFSKATPQSKSEISCQNALPGNLIHLKFLKLLYLYSVAFCVKTFASDAKTSLFANILQRRDVYATHTARYEYCLLQKTWEVFNESKQKPSKIH